MCKKLMLVIVILLSGCSTYLSKIDYPTSQVGHPYSGVSMNLGSFCNMPDMYDNDSESGDVAASIIATPFVVAFGVADLVLSVVFDTLFLPVDLISEPENKRLTISEDCSYPRNFPNNYEGNLERESYQSSKGIQSNQDK